MDSLCKISNGNDTRIDSSAVWVCIDGTSADTTFWIVSVAVVVIASETLSWIESNKDDDVSSMSFIEWSSSFSIDEPVVSFGGVDSRAVKF